MNPASDSSGNNFLEEIPTVGGQELLKENAGEVSRIRDCLSASAFKELLTRPPVTNNAVTLAVEDAMHASVLEV